MKKLPNPFIISGYHSAEYFCDRVEETQKLTRELMSGNNIALIATRRIGKSGLIKHCFAQEIIRSSYYTFYVDIYSTRSLQEFVYRLGREILLQLKPLGRRMIESFWNAVGSIQAGISISPMGEPSFNLQVGDIKHAESTLEEIFRYLESADRPCIVAIDEFQQIANFMEDNTEALLRTFIQDCSNAHFIFAGSQRHLISQIFSSPSRPFYQSASVMSIESIDIDKYKEFAMRLFADYGKQLEPTVVEQVYKYGCGITWYIQKQMNTLFSLTSTGSICTFDMVSAALDDILSSLDFAYKETMFRIPDKQRKLLIAIAKEGEASAITSGTFIHRHNLSSPSSIQAAMKGLLEKDFVTYEHGHYRVYDVFLMYWLQRAY